MIDSMTVTELKQEIDSGTTKILLDVREPWEYALCHIEGSINMPLSQITAKLQEIDKSNDLVVICHHGARSFQAGCYLQSEGFNARIYNLQGGVDAWADTIDPQMPKY
jgi:rhodanese-related sulfurtransferase